MPLRALGLRYLLPALLIALSACETTGVAPVTTPRPPGDIAPPEPEIVAPSPESEAERLYYARVEANYLAQDLLRADGGGEDTPFGPSDVVENFLRIAFFDEFTERGGRLVAEASENRLHRWQRPVRVAVEFGASVPAAQRSKDRADVNSYLARLSSLTGLPIRMTAWRANHTVFILNADERAAAGPVLTAVAPQISGAALRSVTEMRPDTYCTVFSFSPGKSAIYSGAVTVIRGELPDRLRLACIHEELAQSLGLVADHPHARPSIFNDNEEFALLTRQDELLLRILYDPRLWPGMTLDEARPVVRTIVAALMAGES